MYISDDLAFADPLSAFELACCGLAVGILSPSCLDPSSLLCGMVVAFSLLSYCLCGVSLGCLFESSDGLMLVFLDVLYPGCALTRFIWNGYVLVPLASFC